MLPTRGQSDNLALLGVVDNSSTALTTQAALRWAFRYTFGFPSRIEVYARARRVTTPAFVGLQLGAQTDGFVGTITGNAQRTAGGLRVAGAARVAFARPMISIGVCVAAAASPPSLSAATVHSPAILEIYPSAAHPPAPLPTTTTAGHPTAWFTLNGDCIDALELRGDGVVIAGLLVVPLHDALGAVAGQPDWAAIGTLKLDPEDTTVWPAPSGLQGNPAPSISTKTVLHDLFRGAPAQPMALRTLASQASASGSFSVPELGALLLAATQPAEARELNLLVDLTSAGHATAGANDYLVNAVWNDAAPALQLTPAQGIDFSTLAATATSLGQTYTGDPRALVSSSQPLTLVAQAPGGLTISPAGVWVSFAVPQQRVEGVMASNTMHVEATAFATLPTGQLRVVDWTATTDPSSFFLQAERIDAIYLAPVTTAPLLRTLRFTERDDWLQSAPSARAGQVFAATFALGHLAPPSAPAPLTATTLPDDVGAGLVRVGLSFDVSGQAHGLSAGAASYVVASGPSASQLQPLVDPLAVPCPAGDPPSYALFDEVHDGDTRAYSVTARDYFGRLSAPATTAPALFTNPRPLPPPFDLIATVDSSTAPPSVALTWQWPPPGVAVDARLQHFELYWKPGGAARPTTDGTVAAVSRTPGEKGATFTRQSIVHVTTSIAPASVDATRLPGASVRVGGDFYVVDASETIHGAGGDQLALHLCLNPSTPNLTPAVGDAVSIFGPIPASTGLTGADSYSPQTNLPISVAPAAAAIGGGGYRLVVKGRPAWPAADARGCSTLRFGVSAAAATAAIESAVCGPVDAVSVSTASVAPPLPASVDESDVYSDPVDAFGHSHYRYRATGAAGSLYHVYRALDEAVLAECARVGAAGLSAPPGSYPSPIVQASFTAALAGAPAVVRTLPNLALNVYGALVGAERAWARVTAAPLTAAANGDVILDDDTLPGGSVNRYLYRLRAVSASGEPGAWGWPSPPVRLHPNPPTRPTIERVEAQATAVLVAWRANPEPEVDTYLLYACSDPTLAGDERLMGAPISIDAGDATSPRLSYSLTLQPGASYALRLAAVANHTGLPPLASAASDIFLVTPHALRAPLPPADVRAVQQTSPSAVAVTFTSSSDPTARYMLRRRVVGDSGRGTPLSSWQAAGGATVSLSDAAPGAQPCEYIVAVTNDSGRVAFSAAVAP